MKAAALCTDEDMTHEKKGTKATLVGLSGGLRGGTQLSSQEAKVNLCWGASGRAGGRAGGEGEARAWIRQIRCNRRMPLWDRVSHVSPLPSLQVADSIRNITGFSHPPRFQDCNLDTLNLNGVSPTSQQDGAVVDEKGRVLAFWGSFSMQVNNGGRLQDVQVC